MSEALYATYTNRDAPSKAPFRLFLRTLWENCELAAIVKELDIQGWRSEFEVAARLPWAGVTKIREDKIQARRTSPVSVSKNNTADPRANSMLKLFEEVAVKIGIVSNNDTAAVPRLRKTVVIGSILKEDGDFLRSLKHGIEDAQTVLMLALLPNLRRLEIAGMSICPTLNWHRFLRKCENAILCYVVSVVWTSRVTHLFAAANSTPRI